MTDFTAGPIALQIGPLDVNCWIVSSDVVVAALATFAYRGRAASERPGPGVAASSSVR
ncbi:MAG TPA: hypothetical protein VNF73_03825 [Candidatus Saccharimonadales bacterium]|nr:hypothetical protein [Candidatus Saccharimonadales bacterium]